MSLCLCKKIVSILKIYKKIVSNNLIVEYQHAQHFDRNGRPLQYSGGRNGAFIGGPPPPPHYWPNYGGGGGGAGGIHHGGNNAANFFQPQYYAGNWNPDLSYGFGDYSGAAHVENPNYYNNDYK